jgi:hypothetical protein
MRRWHYGKWRGVYFPSTLSSQVPEVEKSKTAITIFSDFFFQFHEFCDLMLSMSIY